MNTKFVTILTLGALPFIATAMPTKAELDNVSPVVADLMKPEQEALKAGKKSKSEVAAVALDLVGKADGEAAKLLLTKGAYNLYVRDGDFDKAIETLKSFREIVPDMEPQYLANIIESSLRTISRKNGGQLYQLLDETRTIARYRDELKRLEAQAKKTPTDKSLQLKLAEHYAVLNDWPKALAAFEQSADRKAAESAKAETSAPPVGEASSPRQKEKSPTSLKFAADHWWNYPARKAPEFEKPFRQHAAKLYEQAIATGELVGLNKVQAERRIEEAKALGEGLLPEKNPLGGVQLWEGGPYWAECNVGASQPEEYGYYFWWGDTVGYKRNASNDGWSSVKDGAAFVFCEGGCPTFKKDNSLLRAAGYIDASGNLVSAHDAATAHLGAPWCMPTDADFAALISNCTTTWTTNNGVHGRLIKGKGAFATKSIFLPAAGVGRDLGSVGIGSYGHYWSSSKSSDLSDKASDIGFDSRLFRRYGNYCYVGWPVRPLRRPIQAPFTSPTKIEAFAHTSDTTLAKSKHEMEEKIAAQRGDKLYCVIDLSGGPNAKRYPVSYLNAVPKGGWTDEYKTTKLVLRRIEPGTFVRGCDKVVVKQPFYIGVFEITQMQYKLICGANPSQLKNALYPVERVSYNMIRGDRFGAKWPHSAEVDDESFLGKLRKRVEFIVDLPTEIQWEYACRAGSKTVYFWGDAILGDYAWYATNSIGSTHPVGRKLPNVWGLYDISGNVWEWCLDWYGTNEDRKPNGANSGSRRVFKGGSIRRDENWCTSAYRDSEIPSLEAYDVGFRLAIQPPFVPQKTMDGSTQSPDTSLAKAKREMEEKIAAQREDKLYCVIDLSGGPNAKRYPVTYLNSAPKTGWSDAYKTTKLVLRKIKPGSFMMGDQVHSIKGLVPVKVAISKAFYVGVFEVTQRQWELIMGDRPSFWRNDNCYEMRPVESFAAWLLRGDQKGAQWPKSSAVDDGSFIALVRDRSGLNFDLPTEAQWEYACRSGRKGDYGTGENYSNPGEDKVMSVLGRYEYNGGWLDAWGSRDAKTTKRVPAASVDAMQGTSIVGSYKPNDWGLYDMHGNVSEYCVDWRGALVGGVDPLGAREGDARVRKGGCWNSSAQDCIAAMRHGYGLAGGNTGCGFRLAIQP